MWSAGSKAPEGTTVTLEMYHPAPTTTTTVAGEGADAEEETTEEEAGSTADLSQLPPDGETTEYTLTRRTIEIPVTERETMEVDGKKVAYIGFYTFSEGSAKELRGQVEQAGGEGWCRGDHTCSAQQRWRLLNEAWMWPAFLSPDVSIVSTKGSFP
jgi:hypothetical protein